MSLSKYSAMYIFIGLDSDVTLTYVHISFVFEKYFAPKSAIELVTNLTSSSSFYLETFYIRLMYICILL